MSFNTGLSGLNAAAKSLDVIGHNISNANTIGMKAGRAEFSEVYASSLAAAGSGGFGIGVNVAAVSQQFTQGNITVTGNDLDVAINGAGFFVLDLANGSRAYSRAGNFKLNAEGNIVTNDGAKLIDPSSNTAITLPTGKGVTGAVTTNIVAELNLDTRAPNYVASTNTPPLTTYGTTVQAYDSQGAPINVDMYFRKSAANTWDVYANYPQSSYNQATVGGAATVVTSDGAGGWLDQSGQVVTPDPLTTVTTQTGPKTVLTLLGGLQFDDFGNLTQTRTPGGAFGTPQKLSVPGVEILSSATTPFNMTLDLSGVTQNASSFTVTSLEQDGRAPGQLTGIQIEADGAITARYSNGQTLTSGQVQLANFRNVSGLSPLNGGYWTETSESGVPVVSKPGTGNFGQLRAGALEESNVDLTAELVNMMTAQRTYQANAQTIKTQDQVLSTLVNLR